jgi:hypothetical protein
MALIETTDKYIRHGIPGDYLGIRCRGGVSAYDQRWLRRKMRTWQRLSFEISDIKLCTQLGFMYTHIYGGLITVPLHSSAPVALHVGQVKCALHASQRWRRR